MPDKSKYEIEFRPKSYWENSDRVMANIKGELRKRFVVDVFKKGSYEDLANWMFEEDLPENALDEMIRNNLQLIGGEYLPCYENGEVEIARIAINNYVNDVISIRAQRTETTIYYSVRDEYESKYAFTPQESKIPLSFGDVINLIESLDDLTDPGQKYTNPFRDFNLPRDIPLVERLRFVTVSSIFYPMLESWFLETAAEWYFHHRDH